MARSDRKTYETYPKDVFDNPPSGPVGVHRGKRSLAVRVAPFVVVVIVAALAGLLVWGAMSGELAEIQWPWQSQTADDQSDDAESDAGDDAADDAADDAVDDEDADADDEDADADAADDADATTDDTDADDADADDTSDDADTSANQTVNYNTNVRVINATGVNGYAAQQQSVLQGVGYTNVDAANPSGGSLPSTNIVWYQNETDLATAQNVADTLGISTVSQVTGIAAPIVVVYITAS